MLVEHTKATEDAIIATDEDLIKFGFEDYSIDFSCVADEDVIALLSFIKERNKLIRSRRLGG